MNHLIQNFPIVWGLADGETQSFACPIDTHACVWPKVNATPKQITVRRKGIPWPVFITTTRLRQAKGSFLLLQYPDKPVPVHSWTGSHHCLFHFENVHSKYSSTITWPHHWFSYEMLSRFTATRFSISATSTQQRHFYTVVFRHKQEPSLGTSYMLKKCALMVLNAE